MNIETTKTPLSQQIKKISRGTQKIAKGSLCIGLVLGQVLWPFHYAVALPSFQSGENIIQDNDSTYSLSGHRAVADWNSFVISNGETMTFTTNEDSSILLNLVTGG